MKTIVSVQEIAELEIKPAAEVAEWRRLVESEIASRWPDRSDWIAVQCPCCRNAGSRPAFAHAGMAYVECTDCGSLYAPRRPSEAALADWYRSSAASHFWRDRLLKASGEARLEKIVIPRAQWVLDGIAEYAPRATSLLDVSANGRPFIDEVASGAPQLASLTMAALATDGDDAPRIHIRPTPIAKLAALGPVSLVTALDAFDRAADLPALVDGLGAALEPDGVLFATLPVASGFEVQTLWERSPTIFPPDKINVPTIDGLMRLFAAPRWELLELSTPGIFDAEIVHRTMQESPDAEWPRAVRALAQKTSEPARHAFTEYLQSQRLTSFARLVARRRT
jgi:ribosomal protein S27E